LSSSSRNPTYRGALLLSASLLCGLGSQRAGAQTPASAASTALETVTVTAQRRVQDIEKTAVAVTAISGRALTRQVILSPSDLNGLVPGAVFIGNNQGLQVAIRGIANNAIAGGIANDLSVSLFIDDMIEARGSGGAGVLFDVDNVQVLRGPQGTLYGRNNTAGAVNIYNAKPTDKMAAAGSIEVGNYALIASEGMVNVPLSGMIDARASFRTINHGGYLKDGYDDEDDAAGRLRLLFKPAANVSFLLTGDYLHQGGKGTTSNPYPPGTVRPAGYDYGAFPGQPLCPGNVFPGPHPGSCIGSNSKTDDHADGVVGELNWDLGWGNLTDIGGYRQYINNDDRFEGSGASLQYNTGADDWWSEELRLANAAGSPIKWIGGLYYYGEALNATLVNYPQRGLYSTNLTPASSSTSYAAYAQGTYPITDRPRFTAACVILRTIKPRLTSLLIPPRVSTLLRPPEPFCIHLIIARITPISR